MGTQVHPQTWSFGKNFLRRNIRIRQVNGRPSIERLLLRPRYSFCLQRYCSKVDILDFLLKSRYANTTRRQLPTCRRGESKEKE